MTKPAKKSDDPLIMAVRKALQEIEPRPIPTETIQNSWGHTGWKCPICSEYVRRKDRYVLEGPAGNKRRVLRVDYGSYNMHFGAVHATPFWREQNIIKTVKRYL